MSETPHGVINHTTKDRRTDYLYRVSLKCLIQNSEGQVLVVKESGRDWWDLPGGGMDHGESIRAAIAREMAEEVNMTGDFTYRVIAVEDPKLLLPHGFWQIRLIFQVYPHVAQFSAGEDGDEVEFRDPSSFKNSDRRAERRIYEYAQMATSL